MCCRRYAGVPYNQNEMFIRLGDLALMENGQPLPFDKNAASKYLKDVTSVHGTVYIEVYLHLHICNTIWLVETRCCLTRSQPGST